MALSRGEAMAPFFVDAAATTERQAVASSRGEGMAPFFVEAAAMT